MASEYCTLTCARCGDCCRKHGLYPVTSSDIADIARGTGISAGELLSGFCTVATHDGRKGLFTRGSGMACPFLAGDECSIHAFKPMVCSVFPDNDGYVTVRRLKEGLKASTVSGEGLSRCAAWSLPDDGVLAPDIENTARFRIREDTDAQYFIGHDTIDEDTVDFLARLAETRVTDLPLYLATSLKYGMLRQLHTVGLPDVSPLIQAERDILYRYCGTYATACMLPEALITCNGVRATFVDGHPGIMVMCDEAPPAGGEARFLWRRYGETGIFAAFVESGGFGHATAFVINTPCLDDIISDGKLHLAFSDGAGRVSFACKKGIL
ncbi:MAG: Flagellin N-methylase [Methanocella sp. PtaU1.Bin125]|nr:MAG: Flagellin N-methylase [Methanocella sp. PtaU1.Bin125]